ncbi:hypothetical protein A2Z00_03530 [Candidatus Gottesmanbacteria bacterium RBG_13_45_10]|uniref:Fimbrial assembly protein n=1 Tax=Candidatus Gottesmanbacteria bacterium RBG_13_45_10 TaxID=1798370 RepID=A0A1F5ZGG8_9BACT|nr:MAG: hypothetical protein A2Z00_03530 [Candidatus Gottesmanbacteria bacterium RBG_13_45_10]
MATSPDTINLIRTKTGNSSQVEAVEASLRNTAFIGVALFVFVGVITGLTYIYFSFQQQSLTDTKNQLVQQVNNSQAKEGLLLSIKARTQTVAKAMANQRPWARLLDNISSIVSPPTLASVAVDERNKIVVVIRTVTVDQLVHIVEAFIKEAQDNRIRAPQILSFQLDKTGEAQISISFTAIF